MEEKLGRLLEKGEIVHHINHVTDDNRPENLMVLPVSEHMGNHRQPHTFTPESKDRLLAGLRKGQARRWGPKP